MTHEVVLAQNSWAPRETALAVSWVSCRRAQPNKRQSGHRKEHWKSQHTQEDTEREKCGHRKAGLQGLWVLFVFWGFFFDSLDAEMADFFRLVLLT